MEASYFDVPFTDLSPLDSFSSLLCSETLNFAPCTDPSFYDSSDDSLKHKLLPPSHTLQPPADPISELRGKRKYKSYSNDDKISFLKMAEKIGKKQAAFFMKISWSTAKTWIKKDENLKQTKNTYTQQLLCKCLQSVVQGDKKKIGVGRKITYDMHLEEQLLSYAMVTRESDGGLSIKKLKQKAIDMIKKGNMTPSEKFKGSDGWAKKFCKRNLFDINDKFNCPRYFPKYLKPHNSLVICY